LKVKEGKNADFVAYDLAGKIVLKNELTNQFEYSALPKNQVFIIKVLLDNRLAIIRVFN